MKATVSFTNGTATREYESIQEAATELLAEYPGGVICDAGGFAHDADDTDDTYDVRSGRAGMVWASEEESVNDDGAGAVAEISAGIWDDQERRIVWRQER